MTLEGKVAIVTGSGRGLGLAYAKELARQGAAVVVNDIDPAVADAAVTEITAAGGRAIAVAAPVGPTETAQRLVAAAAEEFGRLDILVTNAGVLRDTVLWKMSDDDFDTVIDVHLRGTFTCVREAASYMRANEIAGRIVCIGSPTGQRGNFGQTNYAATKGAVISMTKTWAKELGRKGIRANAICPGSVNGPRIDRVIEAEAQAKGMTPDAVRQGYASGTAMKRLSDPEDVAAMALFLASDGAKMVSGQALAVDGMTYNVDP